MAHLRSMDRLESQGTIPDRISRELARMRPGLEKAYAVQEAIDAHGTKKEVVHHLCTRRSLTRQDKLVLRKLMEENPSMLLGTGHCPLRVAACQMNLDAVKVILAVPQAIGQDAETPALPLLSGFIKSCYTASRGSQANRTKFDNIFDALIEVSSIRDEKSSIGWTPLMEAARADDLNMLRKLVNKGVDVTAATSGSANYDLSDSCQVEFPIFDIRVRGGQFQHVWRWTALHEAISQNPHGACANFLRILPHNWPCAKVYCYRYEGTSTKIDTIGVRNCGFYVEN